MAEIQKTNICSLDLTLECVEYLKEQGLNVYEGSLGSVFHVDWRKGNRGHKKLCTDIDFPENLQEYHVFVADTTNAKQRDYKEYEHNIKDVDCPDNRCLVVMEPVSILDLRPFGTYRFENSLHSLSSHRRIEVVFIGPYYEVDYTSTRIAYFDPKHVGTFNNLSVWGLSNPNGRSGERTQFADTWISRCLFEGRRDSLHYHHTFHLPSRWDGDKMVQDERYFSILDNEDGECVSFIYAPDKDIIRVVLPNVEDKAGLLKDLFENLLFTVCSEFFPDIEAKSWIHSDAYLLPDELEIQGRIEAKRQELNQEIKKLEEEEKGICENNSYLKHILTETGGSLVKAVKTFLEWLGFENVIDKDETLKDGELKEEDLCLDYEGVHVLFEVKGINGTSTDGECSQIDKIVTRRMRQLKTTDVHGVYIVNNQKNMEPLKRNTPPFNNTQIKDAEDQNRTMIYTAQLFALYSDVENGYISKEEARKCFLHPGLADFHSGLFSLGVPYDYYQKDTVVCIELNDLQISVGDVLFYKDKLNRLVGCKVESIKEDEKLLETAKTGRSGFKVGRKVPRNREIMTIRQHPGFYS